MPFSLAEHRPLQLATIAAHDEPRRFRIAVILQTAILLSVIANLGRIPVFSTGERAAPLLANDVLAVLVIACSGLAAVRARSLKLDAVAGWALAWAAVAGGSAILAVPRFGISTFEMIVGLGYLGRWLLYFGLYVSVINSVRASDVTSIWNAAENMLLIFAVFGIIQTAFLPGFAQMIYPQAREYYDWDVQGRRLVSTILDPNVASGLILIGALVAMGRLAAGARMKHWKVLVFLTAMVLTLSRSGAVGLFVGSATVVMAHGLSKRMLKLVGAVSILLLIALPVAIPYAQSYHKLGFDASAADRLISWARAYQAFADHPIIGIGYNTFGYVLERIYGYERTGASSYSSDGGLLFVAVASGLLGLGLYLTMFAAVIRRCRRIWRSPWATPEYRGLAIGIAACIVAISFHSLFVNSLFTPLVMELLWIQWGLVFVITHAIDRRAQEIELPMRPRAVSSTRSTRTDDIQMLSAQTANSRPS